MAIKRLKRDALIRVDAEGPDYARPRPAATSPTACSNRHHLIERMLTEIFGLEWYKVHDEAEQLEHAVSADFERKLVEQLGAGGSLPARQHRGHGFARRRAGSAASSRSKKRSPGERLVVVSVFERDRSCWSISTALGIRPGAEVEVDALGWRGPPARRRPSGWIDVPRPPESG